MLKPRSFDTCRNTAAPMIAMLDCLEIDTEISDTSMKTVESNDYREVLRDNGNANRILVIV